jgi:hypothetical protein
MYWTKKVIDWGKTVSLRSNLSLAIPFIVISVLGQVPRFKILWY